MVKKVNLFFLMGLVFFIACAPTFKLAPYFPVDVDISPEIQAERDEIYSLAAYAVVLNDYKILGGSITRFLLTDEARSIYANAANALNTYVLKYPSANAHILTHVQETVKMVKPGIPQINIKGQGGTG